MKRVEESVLHHDIGGDWRLIVYANTVEYAEHLALVKGDFAKPGAVPVRMHGVDLIDDFLGAAASSTLRAAMRMIAEEGRGVVVLLREMWPTKLSERVRRLGGAKREGTELRDYGIGAQILLDLGVRDMVLLSNTQRTIVGWEGYGLTIVEQRRIETAPE